MSYMVASRRRPWLAVSVNGKRASAETVSSFNPPLDEVALQIRERDCEQFAIPRDVAAMGAQGAHLKAAARP